MARIMVDPNALNDLSAQLFRLAAEQEALTHKTYALIHTVGGVWQGRGSTEFAERLTHALNEDDSKVQLLREYALQLQKMAETYMQTDSAITQKFIDGFKS